MRRRRTSTAEYIIEIVAAMPWWVGVLLALVSYLVLTVMASSPASVAASGLLVAKVFAIMAGLLRYALPVVFLIGAAASAFSRAHRAKLLDDAQAGGANAVAGITWQQFELLVGEAFRRHGYTVTELGGLRPDGGVDLILRREGEKALVQCKHWKTYRVGVGVVRELLGAMTAAKASRGWIITSGRFTADAEALAREHRIELVDGERLPALLRRGSGSSAASPGGAASFPAATGGKAPDCPVCSKPMVRRVARKGSSPGLLGLRNYPDCRGTRSNTGTS